VSQFAVRMHRQVRSSIHAAIGELSAKQLQAVPDGFDNNIAWNVGHLLVVQPRILYARCGLPVSVDEEMVPLYLPGTSPADWESEPDAEALVAGLLPQQEQLEEDYGAGRFDDVEFEAFTTGSGMQIGSLEDAFTFNLYHESQHYGFVQALVNAVS